MSVRVFLLFLVFGCAEPKLAVDTAASPVEPETPTATAPASATPSPTSTQPPSLTSSQVVPPSTEPDSSNTSAVDTLALNKLCREVDGVYRRNKWADKSPCSKFKYSQFGTSVQGRPLLAYEAGDLESRKLTLVQCGIHGDELPSLAMCFRLIDEIEAKKVNLPSGTRLVVQWLLNPDGFLAKKVRRPNARGVDINRNFPTKDWAEHAVESWEKRDRKDKRKFPGKTASSEPETAAIVKFIEQEKPQKIISIHTPLGFLDLDSRGGPDKERRAKFLAINMSKNSGNYLFKTFGIYPGSLGNFAGRERHIPVYTLELPPGDSRKTIDFYWKKFRVALWRAIDFDLETGQFNED